MTFDELENYLKNLPGEILSNAAEIVAETATESFKKNFTNKGFDGNPWKDSKKKKKTGSLLVDSGALSNSIRPSYVGIDKVVISAGNEKVTYAQVHNEGFVGSVMVSGHTRTTKIGVTVQVKSHNRDMNIPKRQFMGKADETAKEVRDRIQEYINYLK